VNDAPAVETVALAKSYGETHVLRDVTFAVPRGAMLTITGRSGSGKSTLFKLLAGLDRPTSGRVVIDGTDISRMDDKALSDMRLRHVGLVFQTFNLLPDLTIAENVRLPMDIAGVPRKDAAARAHELLALLGLDARAERLPNVLSGGEAQRAAIARALANRPALLLADEPTGSLDEHNANHVLDAFEEINKALGASVLIVTHDDLVTHRFPAGYDMQDGRLVPVTRRR
jgi:lipoprotein-releasing system ATP-binding protein